MLALYCYRCATATLELCGVSQASNQDQLEGFEFKLELPFEVEMGLVSNTVFIILLLCTFMIVFCLCCSC